MEFEEDKQYAALGLVAFIALLTFLIIFPTDWNAFTANVANFVATIGGAFSTIGNFITGENTTGDGAGLLGTALVLVALIAGLYYYTQHSEHGPALTAS